MKFKIGDKVKVISKEAQDNGYIGKIKDIDISDAPYRLDNSYWHYEEELELVEETTKQIKVKAYLSHPITGKYGANCKSKEAQDYMKHNCEIAIDKANKLRQRFPQLDIYVPAEIESFVGRAYIKGYMDVDKILEIDCEILGECDLLIIAPKIVDGISNGMKKEILYACDKMIPIFHWNDFARIEKFIQEKQNENTNS